MEPRNIEIDYKELYEKAIIENEQMASKIEMQEALIAQQETQIRNQENIIRALEKKLDDIQATFDWTKNEADMLEAQMEVVRLIFGGRGND